MATTYTDLAKKVLRWANRDGEVLSYAEIKDFINYGVDNAYRNLRVAPMENVRTFKPDSEDVGEYKLEVPVDLVEIIQLRVTNNNTDTRLPSTQYDVFEAKSDIRSFYNDWIFQDVTDKFYAREQDNFLISPSIQDTEETYEVYYYRRLPEVDARYTVSDTEYADLYYEASSKEALIEMVKSAETDDVFTVDPDLEDNIVEIDAATFRLGKLAPNWLRDNNEKVVLYGALMQAGIYLAEADLEQRYTQRFTAEIETLNREDKMRIASGGNVQVKYTAYGLI